MTRSSTTNSRSDSAADDPVGVRFHLRGRVQGVGFRWWARSLARDLGVGGTVRNLPDGSVEIVAAGSGAAVARLRAALQRGPPGADVRSLCESPAPAPQAASFEIVG
jgi:acylphosphatase